MQYNPPMPVYMITLHTYRSWKADNPKGYVQRGKQGIQTPNPVLASQRACLANDPERHFNDDQKQFIIDQAYEIITNRKLRLHAVSCTSTHTHLIISWLGTEAFFSDINQPFGQARLLANKVKTILATLLSKNEGTTGNRWFSRGCDCTPVDDRDHLNHLLDQYLPKHRREGGLVCIFDKGKTTL